MKIVILSPSADLSGGQRVVSIYADRLKRRGHDVIIVSASQPRPSLRAKIRSVLRGRGWPKAPRRRPAHFDDIDVEHRVIDRYRPITDADVPDADVVVATWWETAEWVARLSPCKGVKVYFIQHHEVHQGLPVERVEATWRLPLSKIAVAQWLVDLARDRYGDEDVALVPNSVDTEQFHAPPHTKQSVPTIGLMYSTTPFKGCDISLRAFAIAAGRVPGLHLVAFGAQPVAPELPLPAGSEYHCTPQQSRIKDIYSRCDSWLFGSRSEGFGLPILEAMACRTPVIGTPAGAAPELLAGGGGILVKAEDPRDMARAIETVCKLPDNDWARMSEAAFLTAHRYTWDDTTDLLEVALQSAVEKSRIHVI